jgi:hypothetical protein
MTFVITALLVAKALDHTQLKVLVVMTMTTQILQLLANIVWKTDDSQSLIPAISHWFPQKPKSEMLFASFTAAKCHVFFGLNRVIQVDIGSLASATSMSTWMVRPLQIWRRGW